MCEGGWIESAGGNYPLKLPPQLPTVSSVGNEEEGESRRHLYFPYSLPPSRPLLYEANRRRDHRPVEHNAPLQPDAIKPVWPQELRDDTKSTPRAAKKDGGRVKVF